MKKKDSKKDKILLEDIKMRYINTSNLEKIGDLLKNCIETRKGTKIKETFEQERKTDGPVWKHFP